MSSSSSTTRDPTAAQPEAAGVESSARPFVSGLWEECVAGGRDGSVHMADARGTDFEEDDDTVA